MSKGIVYSFDAKELVTAVIKHKGIHEGIWALGVRFDFIAINTEVGDKPLRPGAMATVESYFLERTDKITALSVDAAVVNPSSAIIHPFARH